MSKSPEIAAAVEWDTGEDERHFASTSDGWRVALYRYLFDCHPDYSLAITLGLDARS